MSSPPPDSSSAPLLAEEEEQLLANNLAGVPEQVSKTDELVQTKDEEAELSDHSDSWEVISRISPVKLASPEKEEETEKTTEAVKDEEQGQATEPAVLEENEDDDEEEENAFAYTSTPEEIHSDADTYRTDDLFRHGELDFFDPGASPTTATEGECNFSERAQHGAMENAAFLTSPQKSSSCTPTEDDDFIKLAAAIMHEHQALTTTTTEEFDNAEGLALKRYVVTPATAVATAVVDGAHALTSKAQQLVVTLADRLRAFAVKFRAYVTNLQPKTRHLVGSMASTVQHMALSLQVTAGPGVRALSIPLHGAGVLASDILQAVRHVACTAATRARKGANEIFIKDFDWMKLGLAIGCAGMLGMLWKVNAANAELTCRLAQREGELAELVARIVALQRNITSHRVPIIRHTTASTFSTTVGWPLLVQTI